MYRFGQSHGAALLFSFIALVSLTIMALALLSLTGNEIKTAGVGLRNMQAFYIAEAGLAKARWALTTGGQLVPWTEPDTELRSGSLIGTFTVTATDDNGDGTVTTITSSGYIPDVTNPIAQRRVVERNIPLTLDPGTNLSLAATISASSQKLPQNPATNANDGDSGSSWKADSKDDAWLKLDFASSTTYDKVIYSGININSVTIEYSDNDSDYTEVTNAVENPVGTVNFDSISARYLKFSMDVDSNKTAEVSELESYDSATGSTSLGQGQFLTTW